MSLLDCVELEIAIPVATDGLEGHSEPMRRWLKELWKNNPKLRAHLGIYKPADLDAMDKGGLLKEVRRVRGEYHIEDSDLARTVDHRSGQERTGMVCVKKYPNGAIERVFATPPSVEIGVGGYENCGPEIVARARRLLATPQEEFFASGESRKSAPDSGGTAYKDRLRPETRARLQQYLRDEL